jgi:hypothetical protein
MTLTRLTLRAALLLPAAGAVLGCEGGTIPTYPPGLLSHGGSLDHNAFPPGLTKSAGTSAPATAATPSASVAPVGFRSASPHASSVGRGGGGNGGGGAGAGAGGGGSGGGR